MEETKKLTYEQAKDKALNMLAFRSHSEKELYNKLIIKGADENDATDIIEFCRKYNLVCDRTFAINKAKDLRNLKKYGKYRIKTELQQSGISSEYIEDALSQIEDIDALSQSLVEKKLRGDFSKKNIDRAIRYFLNKGYSFHSIKECIERITENEI